MRRMHGIAGAVLALSLAVGGTAYAHGADDVERPAPPTPSTGGYAAPAPPRPPAAETSESEEHHAEAERFFLGLDMVLGWGNVPFAVQNLPANGSPNITYSRGDKTPSNVQSFVLEASAEVAHHLGVGVRLPFTFAGFTPNGSAARSTTDVGNVEIEGEYGAPLGRSLRFIGSLAVTLPTAQGDEIPADLSNAPTSAVDQTAYDRWSLARAAAFARGYEDNALFEPKRLGIIPKVGVLYHVHGLSIEPYVKLENLIGTSTTLAHSYLGELVGGVRVGYWIHRRFEVALKGWLNAGLAGADEDKKVAAAMEPQLTLLFGPVRPFAGVIIPLAGLPNDNGFLGVRVGVAAAF